MQPYFALMRSIRVLFALPCLVMYAATNGQSVLDSLLKVLPGQNGIERVRTLGNVAWEMGMATPQRALAYGEEALKLASNMKDSAAVAIAANDMAITEYRLGHMQRAIALNTRALRIREQARDTFGIAASHSKIAVAYTDMMNFDSALVHNYASERIFEQLHDIGHLAQVRGNIGHLYQQMGDLNMAEKVIRQTIAMLTGVDSGYAMASALGQLFQVLDERDDVDTAMVVGQQVLAMFEELNMSAEVASVNNEMGRLYRKKGDTTTGLRYYQRALEIATRSGDLTGEATYLMNVANVLSETGHPQEAVPLFQRSVQLCRNEGYADQHMSALAGYISALEAIGDVRGALAGQKELQELKDSVYKEQRIASLSDMQVKYETERTEKELAQERERTLQQQAHISRQRLLIGVISGAVLVVALLAWALILRQSSRSREEQAAAVITEREQGLKALVERTDAERKRIAGELHDGVGQLLTGLKYRVEAAVIERPELKELLSLADDASREVRGIAHRMMPRALGELGLVPALSDMLDRSLKLPGMRHSFEHFGLEHRLAQHVETGVYRIAQELVNNIIKHAQARNVQVQLLRNKGHLVLIVEDDGVGIDPARASIGLGMRGLRDRARVLHGTLDIERGADRGTIATLRVPLTNGNMT